MNQSAREQCQPHFTRGLPLPAADLSQSSRELLEPLALPDQRSSTDFKPNNSPLRLPEGSSRAEAGCSPASVSPGAGAATPRRGAVPSQRGIARCTRQKYLKIWEKSSPTVQSVQSHIPPLGTAGSALRSIRSGGIRAEARGAGKRLSILPRPDCRWVHS